MPIQIEEMVEQLSRRVASSFYGKYRGTVTDNADPDKRGRIKAQVPAVLGEAEVGWALPAFPFAGDGHGHVMVPDVGAAVWIEFEAGQLDFPIWSGAFFLASQQPPSPEAPDGRVIVSKHGHRVVLDDGADEVVLEHSGGPVVTMTASEMRLEVGQSTIVLSSTGTITINNGVLKVGPGGVSLAQGAMTLGVPPT